MKTIIIIICMVLFAGSAAFSLHEIEFKDAKYVYGFLKKVNKSDIIFNSPDLEEEFIVSKNKIANIKQIKSILHLTTGEKLLGLISSYDNQYVYNHDVGNNQTYYTPEEVVFFEYYDRNNDNKIVPDIDDNNDISVLFETAPAPAKYNMVSLSGGHPGYINLSFFRSMGIHELGIILGATEWHDYPDVLTFEFNYAYLIENNRIIQHGVFTAIGYDQERAYVYNFEFEAGDFIANNFIYAGGGYKINIYFVNLKLGFALPISQSHSPDIPGFRWDKDHLLLFQAGVHLKF